MRRRDRPEPEPAPIDPARIRELVTELYDAHGRGESIHATPDSYLLDAAAGFYAYLYARSMICHPEGPRPLDDIVAYVVEHAPQWLAMEERHD